jgi:uncharacterized protein
VDAEDGPERKCVVTGESQPRSGLVRFVVGPDEMIVPDIAAKLPGRGFYVTADRAAMELAVKKKLFAKAARQAVSLPDDLPGLVESLLLRRVIDLMSMARKAGEAVTGLEKTKEWLVKGKARVLIQASDGSTREKTRLRPPPGGHIGCLTAGEMGLAFGRERAIHAALATGGLSNRVVEEAARLAGMRETAGQQDGGITALKDTKDA